MMNPVRITLAASVLVFHLKPVAATTAFTWFEDYDEFREAAGEVHGIDFETLPDGTPSYFGVEITPDFNYTDQGVEFFSPEPFLAITGNPIGGFNLMAGPFDSAGPRNWIIADLVDPARAVGVIFGGGTTVTIFDIEQTSELTTRSWTGPGGLGHFLGVISDVPIGMTIMDSGTETEIIDTIVFARVPEPSVCALLGLAALAMIRRRQT